jgi:uncharacterized protein YbjT (DUF2867 family)
MSVRKILVTGATGKQGSAVIHALLANPPPYPHEIFALTRSPNSPSAKALAAKSPSITLLAGDLNDCPSIFASAGGPHSIYGVFSVQIPAMGQRNVPSDIEEQQGTSLIDAALAAGVQHFVYTSVDRGGANSLNHPVPEIGHFASKHKIELHLLDRVTNPAANTHGMTYTILRPVAFYDNLTPDFVGKAFAAMWHNIGSTPLQLVSTRDIGIFAALAFSHLHSEPQTWRNKAISLAGDELTQPQASEIFEKVFGPGRKMPITFGFVGTLIQYAMKELGAMFRWFEAGGYRADLEECRRINPSMQDFATWLRVESGFRAGGGGGGSGERKK